MKTIVHIELSDEDRSDLAKRLRRDPLNKGLITRTEIKELVHNFINQEIQDGCNQEVQPVRRSDDQRSPLPRDGVSEHAIFAAKKKLDDQPIPENVGFTPFVPSRGDEDYLTQPKDPGVAAACRRILDDTAIIEQFAWETIERNRK